MSEISQKVLTELGRVLPVVEINTDYDTDDYRAGQIIGAKQYRSLVFSSIAKTLQARDDLIAILIGRARGQDVIDLVEGKIGESVS